MDLLSVAKRFVESRVQQPEEVQELDPVQWFHSAPSLPSYPFQLKPGVKIVEPAKFYESLRMDISDEKSPRRIFGALQNDLKLLREICEGNGAAPTTNLRETDYDRAQAIPN